MTQHQPCHRGVGTRVVGASATLGPLGATQLPLKHQLWSVGKKVKVTKAESALNLLDGEYAPWRATALEPEGRGPGRETARSWGRGEARVP